ncbi:hypothetical protein [Hyalangium rubrum]|uniref:Uncharacterized protein n=1 Tax=Hyalangium rubrum TaxID=3103134 RepID=A0ABU5H545_9BACT|nr:hypothetical protein [Hyalangium sp. s54d21]MDY7227892.1 hypothetical protein [Hyalangium sp. s54d21]
MMPLNIDELAQRAGFPSRDALAKRVLELWDDPTQSHRNIGIKLLELQRGKRSWWLKRPEAAEALAHALEVDLAELQLARTAGIGLFAFEDFPRARPFDPEQETPCLLGNDDWFEPLGPRSRWIHAPPGSGRSFTVHYHHYRYGARLVHASTLSEALAQLPRSEPVLIEVERAEDEDQAIEQQLLAREDAVFVIAPFPCWAIRNPRRQTGGSGKESPDPEGPQWPEYRSWQPHAQWRTRFIEWISQRVDPGAQINPRELSAWVEREDPQARLFTTPGDLLPLCAFAHEAGGKAWKLKARREFTEPWLKGRFSREEESPTPKELWLRYQGQEAVRTLVHRWFQGMEPWIAPLPKERWLEFLPEAPFDLTTVKRLTEAMVTLKSKKERAHKSSELLAALGTTRREDAFLHLVSARFFQPQGNGTWSFRFAWLASLMAKDLVMEALQTSSPEQWGHWIVGPGRWEVIDGLLDELKERELLELVGRAVAGFRLSSLGSVGAVEALFAALGRRLRTEGVRLDAARVMPLWNLQRTTLVTRIDGGAPVPLTRHSTATWKTPPQWLEDCWAWSLRVEASPLLVPGLEWLYPGWTQPSLSRLPGWMNTVTPTAELFALAPEVVARCQGTSVPPHLPAFLLPACLLVAEERGWALEAEHLRALTREPQALSWLLEALNQRPAEMRQRMAARFWKLCLATRPDLYTQEKPDSPLRRFIDEHLTAEDFRSTLSDARLPELAANLQAVPPRLRNVVLREVLTRRPDITASSLFKERDELDAECLELLLPHHRSAKILTQSFWKRFPQRAMELTHEAARRGDERLQQWIESAPVELYPQLLGILESSASLPAWAQMWLVRWLPQAGAMADRVHALWMRTAQAA